MEISLPYGTEDIELHLPPEITTDVIRQKSMNPIEDLEAALHKAATNPVASEGLDSIVNGAESIVILVADLTRGAGSGRLLPHFIRYVRDLAADATVTVLIARGMHRNMTKAERDYFRQLPGVDIEEHNPEEPDNLSALLLTQRGTPVRTNVLLKDADAIILFSPVSYHYFAGFGGGRKLVLPGCADRAAILANHRLSLVDNKPVTLHPACHTGNLDNNPVHEDMVETVEALRGRGLFAVNFFCNTNGEFVFINAGDPIKAHLYACGAYDNSHRCNLERFYDVMVLSAGGHPADMNLLQAHKALRHAASVMRDGGTILFYAKCEEGVGSVSLEAALKMKKSEFLKTAYSDYALNNQTAVSLLDLTERFEIGMVSAMNVDIQLASGVKHCVNAESFLAEALEKHSADRLVVISHGASVLPVATESSQ
jgi:nickel-dependent lactate racemase